MVDFNIVKKKILIWQAMLFKNTKTYTSYTTDVIYIYNSNKHLSLRKKKKQQLLHRLYHFSPCSSSFYPFVNIFFPFPFVSLCNYILYVYRFFFFPLSRIATFFYILAFIYYTIKPHNSSLIVIIIIIIIIILTNAYLFL